jgi:FkbM family methyltransferase
MGYSQYNEEKFLFEYFSNKTDGFLVDIGAADGTTNSNSRDLIEIGWEGVLVEPGTNNFNKLKKLYQNNSKIILEKIGCSNTDIINTTFYVDKNDEYEQISTFRYEQMISCKKFFNCEFVIENVDIIKTSKLLEKYGIHKIDFISIDTESLDTEVVLGIDFNNCEIDLICVEHESNIMTDHLNTFGFKEIFRTTGNIFFSKKEL